MNENKKSSKNKNNKNKKELKLDYDEKELPNIEEFYAKYIGEDTPCLTDKLQQNITAQHIQENLPEDNREMLKAQYDIKKDKIAQQNKILQLLLGLVATLSGVFGVWVCLCENSSYSLVEILINISVLILAIIAIIFIIIGLHCVNEKELKKWMDKANKLSSVADFVQYYKERIAHLEKISVKKKQYINLSTIFTAILGCFSLGSEITLLILKFVH